jgi:hypothetical protein
MAQFRKNTLSGARRDFCTCRKMGKFNWKRHLIPYRKIMSNSLYKNRQTIFTNPGKLFSIMALKAMISFLDELIMEAG